MATLTTESERVTTELQVANAELTRNNTQFAELQNRHEQTALDVAALEVGWWANQYLIGAHFLSNSHILCSLANSQRQGEYGATAAVTHQRAAENTS